MLKVLVLIIVAIGIAAAVVSDGEGSVERICTSSSRNNECDIKLKMNCIVTKSDDYPNLKGMNCMDARDTLASSPYTLDPWHQCRYDSDGNFINQYTVKVRYTFTICNESDEYDIKLNLKKSNVKINKGRTSFKKAGVAQTLASSQCQTIRKWRRLNLCTFGGEKTINAYYLSMWLTGRSQEVNKKQCSCYMHWRSSNAVTETRQWVEVGNALEPIVSDTNRDYPWSPSAMNGDGTVIALTLPWYDCWPSSAMVYSFSEDTGLWSPLGENLLSGDDDPMSIALSSRGDRVAIVVHDYYGYDYQLRVHDYNAEEDSWLRTETMHLVSDFGSTHFLFMSHDGNRIMYSSSVYSPGSNYKMEIHGQVYNEDTQVWSAIAPVITDSGEYPLFLETIVSNSNADRIAVLGSQILETSSMTTEDSPTIRIYDLSSDMDKWVQVGQDINLLSIWSSAGNEYSIRSINISGEGNHIAIRTCSGEYVTEQDNKRLICDQDYVHVWKLKDDDGSTWVPHGQEAIVGVREPELNKDGSMMVVEEVEDYHEYIRNPLQGYEYDGNSWEPIGMSLEPSVSDEQLIYWKSMGMAYEKDRIIVLKAESRYNTKTTFMINELKDFS
ncbi:hypothetical protein CTEN210_12308 [Chaetoceros tenuissimus]|uniref:Uncharacterized protein n=1 Tax=Chaetoceros tenuissimus TaxID=426638 RepID=A0AAD3H9Q7_9STRA|nr:hypothetical protein CTEN210_12308 [Chaetoceros tenuissimus]